VIRHQASNVLDFNNGGVTDHRMTTTRLGLNMTALPQATLDVNGALRSIETTVTFSTTPTFNAALGNTFKITLTGNVSSSTLSNPLGGQPFYFVICQDATGSRTFVWPINVKGGMTIGSTLSTCSGQSFIYDSVGGFAYATSTGVANQ
jgi:hypothetical protein